MLTMKWNSTHGKIVWRNAWFMHNGTLAHFCTNVRRILSEKFNNRYISCKGLIEITEIAWFKFVGFCIYLKNLFYCKNQKWKYFKKKNVTECENIKNNSR